MAAVRKTTTSQRPCLTTPVEAHMPTAAALNLLPRKCRTSLDNIGAERGDGCDGGCSGRGWILTAPTPHCARMTAAIRSSCGPVSDLKAALQSEGIEEGSERVVGLEE